MTTLLDEIRAKCSTELLASRDLNAIAAEVNIGRRRLKKTSLGEGGIIAAVGNLNAGNAFLDVVNSAPDYRHIKKVISRGDFDLGEPMAQEGVQAMVAANVLTQAQANALCALGQEPDPVTEFEVRCACWSDLGEWLP